jgi:hypothetical protein
MTDKEAMKLALFALDIVKIHYTQSRHVNEAITALKERLADPMREVQRLGQEIEERAWFTIAELNEWADKKLSENPHWVMPTEEPERKEALAQPEQEPVAWMVVGNGEYGEYEIGRMLEKKTDPNFKYWEARGYELVPLYTRPPQRTWIGLEGAEAGWFCHTDFLNARKYTKKQRQHICCQLLSEAQSWDIEEYQLMMHDSTKLKETT